MSMQLNATAIFDVGKTNIKLHLVGEDGHTFWFCERHNKVVSQGAYPHLDVEMIWQWLVHSLREAATLANISAINVCTHGACAVWLDDHGEVQIPILDYEYEGPQDVSSEYDKLRPSFEESLSPSLPQGLNLGRQLFWQRQRFPDQLKDAAMLLLYPQYWVWRLSGRALTEATSLGCHTDLWLPELGDYSELVDSLGIRDFLPERLKTTDIAGTVSSELVQATGISESCRVYCGVHDSNSSFARFLFAPPSEQFAVVSMGTWVVTMTPELPAKNMSERLDTLANVDVRGKPLYCARFMGGREFETICAQVNEGNDLCVEEDIRSLVTEGIMALPPFSDSGGPIRDKVGRIVGTPASGSALASLYLALMIDYELDLLGCENDIVVGSAGRKNPLMCRLLAQLRPRQRILQSATDAATVAGAWCITRWDETPPTEMTEFEQIEPTAVPDLLAYHQRWLELL